jgi:cytochrome c oxidase subunit IV
MADIGHPDPQHHVPSKGVYFIIFALLLLLTGLTVGARQIDLGMLNAPIAMTIAIAKTVLVVLYFMHLRYSTRLTWVVVLGACLWLAVLFVLTLNDYLSRGWMVFGDVA